MQINVSKSISKLWNQAPRCICSPQSSFSEQLSNYSVGGRIVTTVSARTWWLFLFCGWSIFPFGMLKDFKKVFFFQTGTPAFFIGGHSSIQLSLDWWLRKCFVWHIWLVGMDIALVSCFKCETTFIMFTAAIYDPSHFTIQFPKFHNYTVLKVFIQDWTASELKSMNIVEFS